MFGRYDKTLTKAFVRGGLVRMGSSHNLINVLLSAAAVAVVASTNDFCNYFFLSFVSNKSGLVLKFYESQNACFPLFVKQIYFSIIFLGIFLLLICASLPLPCFFNLQLFYSKFTPQLISILATHSWQSCDMMWHWSLWHFVGPHIGHNDTWWLAGQTSQNCDMVENNLQGTSFLCLRTTLPKPVFIVSHKWWMKSVS